jgi:CubicO group peptidase (beta-lactamase class C family)
MSLWRFLPFALVLACGALEAAEPAPYFPGENWRQSTPEAQGLDSTVLAHMVGDISQKNLNVHSVTVLRHGYVVMDAYFYPYRHDAVHDVASVTKSITSALVGIAVDKGLISTDRRLLTFFPNEAPKDPEPTKKQITVDNLLTMRPGMDCGFKPGEQELEAMRRTGNWVEYALAMPMINPPGTKFGYCSPGFHLLSSIVTAATHEPEADFGRKNLFEPIGIKKDVVWPPDPQGRTHGWGDSHFFPDDLARIGYLYLHNGQWNGKQIISSDWVKRSTAVHASTGRPGVDYGYGWWLYPNQNPPEFSANGRGGQKIAVWPEKDMIVIITGAGYPANAVGPVVASAIKSDSALPENAEANRLLHQKIAEAEKTPATQPVESAPAMASQVSGKYYELPRNRSRLDGISLVFGKQGAPEAQVKFRYVGQDLSMPVGLDGVYRLGPNGPLHLLAGARGHWTSDSDFLLDLNFISNINHYTLAMHFAGDSVDIAASESSGLIRNGHITGKQVAGTR